MILFWQQKTRDLKKKDPGILSHALITHFQANFFKSEDLFSFVGIRSYKAMLDFAYSVGFQNHINNLEKRFQFNGQRHNDESIDIPHLSKMSWGFL